MIPGVTPGGTYPLSTLPSEYDLSVDNPLRELLSLSQLDRQYLMIATPVDPSTGNEVTVRISSAGYASMPTDDGGVVHFPVGLVSPYNARISLVSGGRFGGSVAIPAFGDIVIASPAAADGTGRFDEILGYSWNGAPVEIYLGRKQYLGPEFSLFSRIFRGRASSISADTDGIAIEIRDLARSFDRPVTTRTYRGFTAALRFDSSDSVTLGSAPAKLNLDGDFTFECWMRLNALPGSAAFITGWAGGGTEYPFRIFVTPSGLVRFDHHDGTTFSSVTGTNALSAGGAYHVSLSISGGNVTVRILDDSDNSVTSETLVLADPTRTVKTGGSLTFGGGTGPVSGDFWEYRFWGSALDADTIASRRDQGLAGDEAGLLAYYPADTGTGSTLFDEGPNGIDGTISGTDWVGSLEGGADLSGRSRPRVWGIRRQVPAHLVDAQRLVYQVNDGPTESIEPYEQGLSGGWTADGDVADIYASTPAAGHYATQLSKGLFRIGGSPAGTVTADVEGDNVGSYVSTTADVIERIVTTEGGLTTDDYDEASFLLMNTANSAAVGAYSGLDAARITDLLSELMDGVGGWWTFSRDARLELKVRDLATVPDVTLSNREIREAALRRVASPAPVTRISMSYKPYVVTQRPDNLSSSLTDSEKADLGKPVRLVQTQLDGTVKDVNPDAEPGERASLFDSEKAAILESRRQFTIDKREQELWDVPLTEGLFQYWIGTPVDLDVERFGLDTSATSWTVAALNEDAATDQISITVWGVRKQ